MKHLKTKPSKQPNADTSDPLAGDLSKLLHTGDWNMVRFELTKPKNKTITLRLSEDLLGALKKQAKALGLDYQRFIRIVLESRLQQSIS